MGLMAGFDDLDSEFGQRVQSMIAASGGLLAPGSGRRTIEEQIALRRSNGCPDVWTSPASSCRIPTAIPGRSRHNHGLAMDLVDTSTGRAVQPGSAADRWLEANAAAFGLHRPVGTRGKRGYEAWHVEMIDGGKGGTRVDEFGRPIQFGFEYMDEPGNPEDELSNRLTSIMEIITGGPPTAETPEAMTETPGIDVTTIPSDQTFTRETSAGGRAAASGDQLGNAQTIVQVGRELGMPDRAIQIALAAALVESELENVNYGDRDSLGLFQQRPSQGWGSPQQVMNPQYAARKFFEGLSGVNWQGMDPGAAAQAVQRSAYPDRYGKRWSEAQSIFNQVSGF